MNEVVTAANYRYVTHSNSQSKGATENAGLENAAPDCRGGKRGTGKRGTRLAGVENAGVAQYGKPKSPLFNIVTTATSTNVNQKDFTHW